MAKKTMSQVIVENHISQPLLNPPQRWQRIDQQQQQKQTREQTHSPPSSSDSGSSDSDTDDLAFHFKQADLPQSKKWARKVRNEGYTDMDQVKEAEAELDEICKKLSMPPQVQKKFTKYVAGFGSADVEVMPTANFEENAPLQVAAPNKWSFQMKLMVGAAATAVVGVAGVGGAAAAAAAGGGAAGVAAGFATAAAFLTAVGVDCLDGDAEVTLADRKKKKMRDMQKGDKILVYNNGKYKIKTVLEVKTGHSTFAHSITISRDSQTVKLKATEGHPFYVQQRGWGVLDPTQARFANATKLTKLVVNDEVVMRGGKTGRVESIGSREKMQTFNLVLDGPGAFFVHDVLTHSGLPPAEAVKEA